MRVEVIAMRTADSKTFDNGDGTYSTVSRKGFHYQPVVGGSWLDIDCNWHDLQTAWNTGNHPFDIGFVKATRTLTLNLNNGDVITITPTGIRTPTSVTLAGNTVTFVRLWTGVTFTVTLFPEGIAFGFVKTATPCVNPSFSFTGPAGKYHGPCTYTAADGSQVTVPQTVTAGTIVYDFTAVPLGTVVD